MKKPWTAKPPKGAAYWKAKEPQNFCPADGCLFRTNSPFGIRTCPTHPVVEAPSASGHDATVSYDEPGAHGWLCETCNQRTLNDDGMCTTCDASDIAAREGKWPTVLDAVTRHTETALQLYTFAKDLRGAERADAMRRGRAEGRTADNLLAAVLL